MLLETSTRPHITEPKVANELPGIPKIHKHNVHHIKATKPPLHVQPKTSKAYINIDNNDVMDDVPSTSVIQFSNNKNYNPQSVTELKDVIRPEMKTRNGVGLRTSSVYELILLCHLLRVVSGCL